MGAHLTLHDSHSLLVTVCVLVPAPADEGVVDIRHCHDASREGNAVSLESQGVARSVPPLLMGLGNLSRQVEKPVAPEVIFRRLQGGGGVGGVLLHLLELFRREFAGLEQDTVPHPDLPDVVQRRDLEEHVHRLVVEHLPEGLPGLQVLRQGSHVVLGTEDVAARLAVPRFGE